MPNINTENCRRPDDIIVHFSSNFPMFADCRVGSLFIILILSSKVNKVFKDIYNNNKLIRVEKNTKSFSSFFETFILIISRPMISHGCLNQYSINAICFFHRIEGFWRHENLSSTWLIPFLFLFSLNAFLDGHLSNRSITIASY